MANENSRSAPEAARHKFTDNSGHMAPAHAERLRKLSGGSAARDDAAFPIDREEHDLAEALAEDVVRAMTSAEQARQTVDPLDEAGGLSILEPDDDLPPDSTASE